MDMLFIAFTEIVPTTTPGAIHVVDGYTLQNKTEEEAPHPDGLSNADYMRMVVSDATANNGNIRFLTTLDWGRPDQISQIFKGCTTNEELESAATAFAKNAVAFLKAFKLHGFDIDWEGKLAQNTTQDQFNALASALKGQFGDDYLFTLSPATTTLLTGAVVNSTVDFLNLQLYAPWVEESAYLELGIDKSKLAFGATFENSNRQETPEYVYQKATEGNYTIITQWRLNSGNFQQEQDDQVKLYTLCKG
ncbi:MAG: glycoside hydrolase family 18 protein [Gammaproteobacteria bacterium]|nr:glycoside hydrolase family 18 protein [Gammaproteobacteria bacterium]